jgi:hypothetical protein
LRDLTTFLDTLQYWLQLDKNNDHFEKRPTCVCVRNPLFHIFRGEKMFVAKAVDEDEANIYSQ